MAFTPRRLMQGAGSPAASLEPFNYVTMLLHGNGTNGAQNNTFLDSSTNNFTITRNGNTTQGSFSPYGSNWSNFFAYNSTAVNYLVSSSLSLSGDFTIEGYVYWDGVGSVPTMFTIGDSQLATGIEIYLSAGNWVVYSGNAGRITGSAGVVGQWTYISVSRTGSTVTMYINGVSRGTWASSQTFSGTIKVGAEFYGGGYNSSMSGYISNFRVNNTTAINTVPTAPLTAVSGTIFLTCQSNRFIDNSASPLTITVNGTPSVQRFNPFGASTAYSTSVIGGSGYFDGSGDYLTVPDNAALDFGTGNFTMEAWVYATSLANSPFLMHKSTGNGTNTGWFIELDAGNAYFGPGTTGATFATFTSSAISTNNWFHIAVTRVSTTLQCFVNGTSIGTSTLAGYGGSKDNAAVFGIGSWAVVSSAYDLAGYISNLRVVKGTAVYTSNFTPSTTPLTAISGTSLLLNYTNAAIFDNAMMNNLETVGNAQISTSIKKYGTGSMSFDGTGDYLKSPILPQASFNTGSFTIEFWAYLNDNTNVFDFCGTATWANYIGAGLSGWSVSYVNESVSFSYQNNNSYVIDTRFSGTTLSTGTWYHIAIVRSSNVIKCYVNGVASATTISSSTNMQSNAYGVWVGTAGNGNVYSYYLNGYMDDLRITNGYARYTANFTPPTAALTDTGPY
jgi:hypothetical protein